MIPYARLCLLKYEILINYEYRKIGMINYIKRGLNDKENRIDTDIN